MDVPHPPSPKPRRWRKWLKRLVFTGGVVLVLAVVFHRAVLRGILQYGGPKGAEMAGIQLAWQVDGSITGDLKLSQIKASGSMIEQASVGELAAEYDAWRAIQTGDIDIVRRVALKYVDAVVDLRKLPPSEAVPTAPEPGGKKPPPLVWPHEIDIEHVSATITLADGAVIVIRDLSLRIGEGMPGVFSCAEFSMKPGDLRLMDLKADVAWGDHELTISAVPLPYGATLKELKLDLREWAQDAASVEMAAGFGKAALAVSAMARGIFAGAMQVKADAHVQGFTSADWKMPEGIEFGPVNVDVHAEGDPTAPMTLNVDGKLTVSNVKAAGAIIDSVTTSFEVKDGTATVHELKVSRGDNQITAHAEASLAPDVMKSRWTARLATRIVDVTQLLTKPPPAKGLIEMQANAEGVGATPTKATALLKGQDLAFENYKLPKLGVDFAIDGQEATVNMPGLALGDGNTVTVNASMKMEDTMPIQAAWQVQIGDIASLLQTVGLPPLEKPVTAKIATTGKAAFLVSDIMNFDAEAEVNVTDGTLGDAPLPAVALKATASQGEARLTTCRIVVDEQNHLEMTGQVKLAAPWSFAANGDIALPQLTRLNALLAAVKAPAIESGSIATRLDVKGDASAWRGEGRVEMNAAKVKIAGMPEAADVDLKTTFAGTTAKVETLQAVLGPWKLLTKGTVTEKEANLSELSLWQKDRQLMSGHAHAPFDIMQTDVPNGQPLDVVLNAKDLPVYEIAAAAGVKDVPPGILSADVNIGGRIDSADVWVKVGVKELKAPGLPKSFQPATVDVVTTLKSNQLVVDAKVAQAPLQPLTLKAEVPVVVTNLMKKPELAMDLPLKATLDLPESDLKFVREFAPEVLKSVPAKMKLHATVSGSVKAPLIDSALDLNAPEIGFVSADMPSVRDVRVKVRTHGRKATLEGISAMLAGGKVRLGGTIDAADTQDPRFDLNVQAREALVMRNPTSSVRANADIACVGSLKSARVSGGVEVVRGRIFQEVNLLPNVTGMIQQGEKLPPPPPSTSKVDQKLALPPMLKDWTFDLKVKTHDPVVIAGNLVNGAISADIALGGTGAAPKLTGFANVDRMVLKLPFSLLKITKGVVTMNADNPFTPKLDVRGESRVGSNDITLYVYGDTSNPKTRFTSTPPLSEADIVTLLGTGMTLGGDNAQMASEAMSRAAFLYISETYRKLFHKKKTVSAEPPKLHTTFNPSGADRSSDSMQAMYEITPKVRFIARFTQTGQMKGLLGYVLRFGKAARAMDEEGTTDE